VAGSSRTQIVDPRGQPTRLVATINVPRAHIIELIGTSGTNGAGQEEAGARSSDEEVSAAFQRERERIEERVRPHVTTLAADGTPVAGEVVVALVSGAPGPGGVGAGAGAGSGTGAAGGAAAGGGSMLSLANGLVEKGLMLALALFAMGMMFMMVRRVGKRLELPSAEELVGVPPALPSDGELVGEADESEMPMTGIELEEAQLNNEKMREQVEELIKQSPTEAATMLKRWIRDEG